MAALRDLLPAVGADPSEVVDAFGAWAATTGRPLYTHQEDAILALAMGEHVVLSRALAYNEQTRFTGGSPAGDRPDERVAGVRLQLMF